MVHHRRRAVTALGSLLAVSAVFVAACSTGGDSGPSASDLLAKGVAATEKLTAVHVVFTSSGDVSLMAKAGEADVVVDPEAAKGKATVAGREGDGEVPFVFVDKVLYLDPDGSGFRDYGQRSSTYDVSVLVDKERGVSAVAKAMKNVAKAGEESIDGVATTKITGTAASRALSGITGVDLGAGRDEVDVPVTFWIANGDPNNVVRVSAAGGADAAYTVTFSKWNAPVAITKPDGVRQPSTPPLSTPPTTATPVKPGEGTPR